jgi:hypothetical protein
LKGLRQVETKGKQRTSCISLRFVGGGVVDFNISSLFQGSRTLLFLIDALRLLH